MNNFVKVLAGDCLESMRQIQDKSINCCVTSPPYYGLRDYGHDDQIGLEETPELYIANMVKVFAEVKRILRDDGTLWLNISDSYSSSARRVQSYDTYDKGEQDCQGHGSLSQSLYDVRKGVLWNRIGCTDSRRVLEQAHELCRQIQENMLFLIDHLPTEDCLPQKQKGLSLTAILDQVQNAIHVVEQLHGVLLSTNSESLPPLQGFQKPSDAVLAFLSSLRSFFSYALRYESMLGAVAETFYCNQDTALLCEELLNCTRCTYGYCLLVSSWFNHSYVKPQCTIPTVKNKDLIGIPWILAFALRADGWYLRQDIIWHKPNPMPESVKDRCTKAHEYIFLLSKKPKYYFDSDAIGEDATTKAACKHWTERDHDQSMLANKQSNGAKGRPIGVAGYTAPGKRNKRSVWTVTTKPFNGKKLLSDYVGLDGKFYKASEDCPIHAHLSRKKNLCKPLCDEQQDCAQKNNVGTGIHHVQEQVFYEKAKIYHKSGEDFLNNASMRIVESTFENKTDQSQNERIVDEQNQSGIQSTLSFGELQDCNQDSILPYSSSSATNHNIQTSKTDHVLATNPACTSSFEKLNDTRRTQDQHELFEQNHGTYENNILLSDSFSHPLQETVDNNIHILSELALMASDYLIDSKKDKLYCTCEQVSIDHFATFPPDLIEPCILAGCPVFGTVIDPFGGSGTVAGVAAKHNRFSILCELNPDYITLINDRVNQICE